MFTKITYNIQVENRIRIFVRKVRVDKTLWPEKPKETERERERELMRGLGVDGKYILNRMWAG